jgi:hypothetical protein
MDSNGQIKSKAAVTTMANLVRIIGVVAVFVSVPLTFRAAGDYFSPGSSPEMNSRPNVTSEEVFLKDWAGCRCTMSHRLSIVQAHHLTMK